MKADIVIALNPPRGARLVIAVVAALGLGLDVVAGCTSFQSADVPADEAGADAAPDAGDAGDTGHPEAPGDASGDAASHDRGIRCGQGLCPPPNVCCFEADGGKQSCTPSAQCTGAALECTTTLECRDAGKPAAFVCCAYSPMNRLVRSACVLGTACDPAGPQDWLCDPAAPAGTECTDPNQPKCKSVPFVAPLGMAYCAK